MSYENMPNKKEPWWPSVVFTAGLLYVIVMLCSCSPAQVIDEPIEAPVSSDPEVVEVEPRTSYVYVVARIQDFNAWSEKSTQEIANMLTAQSIHNGMELVQMILLNAKTGSYLLVLRKVFSDDTDEETETE